MQGFKSFANRHRFVFPTGITAIVGPNGSGKSNVADAIRWVLGEQRAASLRAKRTDDIIFAGTERRARSGMAQVSVTFDNEDGWLGIDYPEVTIARRAQRDGGSQLLVNGAPVRLRDVIDLLGSRLGQGNYTVIGQGMVDSALTLRPEDRRALVDEAAGLVPLQRRRDRSLRKLAETDENLTRVRDILEETGPRLRRLARLAERAERYQEVSRALGAQLEAWYGFHWYEAREARDLAHNVVRERREGVDRARQQLESSLADRHALEQAIAVAEREMVELRRSRELALESDAVARQASAVGQARLEVLRNRRAELNAALESERASLAGFEQTLSNRREELARVSATLDARRAEADAQRSQLAAAETEREALARAIEQRRASAMQAGAQRAALSERLDAITRELAERQTALAETQAELGAAASRRDDLDEALDSATTIQAERERVLEAAGLALSSAESQQLQVSQTLGQARDALSEGRAELARLRARADAIEALFGELDETRQVIDQLRDASDPDIEVLGSVSQLLEVPEAWESATAAALGQRVQGIVLRRAEHLGGALQLAQQVARGQIVLIGLEPGAALPRPRAEGIGGSLASDLVTSPNAPGLAETLLGDTVFAEDLDSARRLLAEHGQQYRRAATRDGCALAAGGILSAGSPARRILEIERERRALPAALEEAGRREAERLRQVDEIGNQRRELEARIGSLASELKIAQAERTSSARALEAARLAAEAAEREQAWAAERAARIQAQRVELEAERKASAARLAESEPEQARLEAEIEATQSELEAGALTELRARTLETDQKAAAAAQSLAGQTAMLEAAERELAAAVARIKAANARAEEAGEAIAELEAEAGRLSGAAGDQQTFVQGLDARIAPAEAALTEQRHGFSELGAAVEAARRQLSELETEHAEARIAATRAEDRLERLFDQLRSDLEWLPFDLPEQLELGAALEIPLPPVATLPEGHAQELGRLRGQLRVIGAIDQEALAAYSETAERQSLLTAQEADLVAAEQDLRQLLEQLEDEMRSRFAETFSAVATAFADFFPMLFGGGEAELVLEGEDGATAGLEIMARPPGKRRQPLGLLSGGERALTAVALIFALLQVSQTPFVVLDEVDAALDEANVERFCSALRRLAETTQVVVITHNRGTIETAGTVYGVTMAEDGASQIISLQVDATG